MRVTTLLFRSQIFFTKRKRVKELQGAKISLPSQQGVGSIVIKEGWTYRKMQQEMNNLGWQSMNFDKLCSLDSSILQMIQLQIKKDKFNVDDRQFQEYSSHLQPQQSANLSNYYQKWLALLSNDHQGYDQLRIPVDQQTSYLGQMYLHDLTKDTQLKAILTHFINHLSLPQKLQTVAEPTLIKKLLSLKRQLILQGIHFSSPKQVKKSRKQVRSLEKRIKQATNEKEKPSEFENDEENEEQEDVEERLTTIEEEVRLTNHINTLIQQMSQYSTQVEVLEVLNYEHQFWVDVKHNRSKNGSVQDYSIIQKEVPHPNPTILLTARHPTLHIKYITHLHKRRGHAMHFCSKADVELRINKKHIRRVKVEWQGPSSKQTPTNFSFKVIDYEGLMNGNPTVRSIFQF